jgi:hypothetical protein
MQKRATKRQAKHKLRQHAIDAGGVAFIAIENCAICKAKHLNARGIKTRIPNRSHHKACLKNLKTRGTSEMTVFVNKEAAQNLAANRAAMVGCRGRMIAATWLAITTIAQYMLSIFAKRNLVCKSWASHRMI